MEEAAKRGEDRVCTALRKNTRCLKWLFYAWSLEDKEPPCRNTVAHYFVQLWDWGWKLWRRSLRWVPWIKRVCGQQKQKIIYSVFARAKMIEGCGNRVLRVLYIDAWQAHLRPFGKRFSWAFSVLRKMTDYVAAGLADSMTSFLCTIFLVRWQGVPRRMDKLKEWNWSL